MTQDIDSVHSIESLVPLAKLNPSHAFDIALVSARDARQRVDDDLAQTFVSFALELMEEFTPSPQQRFEIVRYQALKSAWDGDMDRAQQIASRTVEEFGSAHEPELLSKSFELRGTLAQLATEYDVAAQFYSESIRWAEKSADKRQRAKARIALAYLYIETHQPLEAARLLDSIDQDKNLLRPNERLSMVTARAEIAAQQMDYEIAEHQYAKAIDYARRQQDILVLTRAHHSLGLLRLKQDRLRAAMSSLTAALRYAKKFGLKREESGISLALSAVMAEREKFDEAYSLATRAEEISSAFGDKFVGAYAAASIGRLQAKQGKPEAAARALEFSFREFLRLKDWDTAQATLLELVDISQSTMDLELITRIEELIENNAPATQRLDLSDVYQSAAEVALLTLDDAILATRLFNEAVHESAEKDPHLVITGRLLYYARLMSLTGNFANSISYIDRALAASKEMDAGPVSGQLTFHALIQRGNVLLDTGQNEKARLDVDRALSIARGSDDRAMKALALGALAKIEMRTGQVQQSIATLDQALGLADELANDLMRADLLVESAAALGILERWEDAILRLEAARSLSVKLQLPDLEANAWSGMAHIALQLNQFPTAIVRFRNALTSALHQSSTHDLTLDLVGLATSLAQSNQLVDLRKELIVFEQHARQHGSRARVTTALLNAGFLSLLNLDRLVAAEFVACAIVLSSRTNRSTASSPSSVREDELIKGVASRLRDLSSFDMRSFSLMVSSAVRSQSRYAYNRVRHLIDSELSS
jgi:tetratricopeptide (TPR) repeat protein